MNIKISNGLLVFIGVTSLFLVTPPAVRAEVEVAQVPSVPEENLPLPQDLFPPEPALPQLDSVPPQLLPLPTDLLAPPDTAPAVPSETIEVPSPEATLCITGFQVLDSTVFSPEELERAINQALAEAVGPPPAGEPDCSWRLTFAQLLLARSAVTALYVDQGYATSGAFLPANQRLQDGIITLQVIEGRLVDIEINGTHRLNPGYVSSRLNVATPPPLNVNELLTGLQLLQLDPLIETIAAELQSGTEVGTSRLLVTVTEADTFNLLASLNNNRSPSVGSFQRRLGLCQGNVLGLGDGLDVLYLNTDGSNEVNVNYTVPVNPYNGTVQLAATFAESRVIDGDFSPLDISAKTNEYTLAFQQPIVQTPEQQFDLGLSLSRRFSQTRLGIANIGPFPLSPGADSQGRTVVSALRFSQNWTQRQANQVIVLRSQFSFGLGGFLGGTVNEATDVPDNKSFAWQGQGQWVRRLGDDSLLLVRGNVQLAADRLLSSEQLGLGGQATVRGYRENELLTDNGLLASVEARFPILRVPEVGGVLQVAPFIDTGYGWNVGGNNPATPTLIGIGTGLLWQQENILARFDWGIPLTNSAANPGTSTLQESGLYFSINYAFF